MLTAHRLTSYLPRLPPKSMPPPLQGPLPPSSACRTSLLCPPTTSQSLSPSHAESLDPLTPILDKASAPAAPGWEWFPSPIHPLISPQRQPPNYVGPALSFSWNYHFHWFSFHLWLWFAPHSSFQSANTSVLLTCSTRAHPAGVGYSMGQCLPPSPHRYVASMGAWSSY